MRKLTVIFSALLLAFLLTAGIFWWQGKSFSDLFSKDKSPTLPSNLTGQNANPPAEETNLTYTERLKKGDEYFQQGFLTRAAEEYSKAALLDPNQITPYLKLIDTHFQLRNYEKALANVESVLKKEPSNQEAQFDRILLQIKLSDFKTAKTLLDSFPTTTPQAAQVYYYKGLLDALNNSQDSAKANLIQALKSNLSPEVASQVEGAPCNYKKEENLANQPNAKNVVKIARLLCSYKEFEATQAAQDSYLKLLLARSLNENEDYEVSINILKETLKARGDLRDGWILLGFAYLNLQNYNFALTAFDKAYSLDPTWATTQYFLGITHKELGHTKEAINYLSAALKGNFEPKIVLQNHLADLYFQSKDYQKAVEAYEAVLAVSKQDVNAFVRPVWLYLDYLNQPEKALKLAQTTISAFPEAAMSYNLVGWSYIGMGDYKNAEANLKRALSLDPKLAAAYHNLGQLNEKWGKTKLALENYQKAYELDRNGAIGSLAAERYNNLVKQELQE